MQFTFIAVIQLAIGFAILLAGSLRSAFAFLLACGLFGGAATFILPALGGSSIPPVQFAIVIVYIHIIASRAGYIRVLPEAVRANRWLVFFTIYGVASAVLAPRIFAGSMRVPPMRPTESADLFYTVLLVPTSQNITSAFYLVGALLVALAAYILCRACRGGTASLIDAGIAVGWAHVLLGIVVLVAGGTPLEAFFELFRNGSYAQHNQSYEGFVRIRGLFPETSSYAEFGFAFMVLNAELWYRSIRPGATGAVAFGLAVVLSLSTSSTAYVGLLAYGLFFILRALLLPHVASGKRVGQFAAAILAIAVMASLLMLFVPALLREFMDMTSQMTVAKAGSESGQQRLFWALQGWEAFKASYGLGIGVGSFRSSSLFTAILGATGVIGMVTFLAYMITVLQPWRRSTYGRSELIEHSIGGAFAVAAVLSLIPAAVSSSKADPGINFAFMAGAALALRPNVRRSRIVGRRQAAEVEASQSLAPQG